MSTKAGAKAQSFASQVLSHMNKDEKEVQKEFVDDTIEDYIIKCETQISIIDVTEVPTLKRELKAAKKAVTKSKATEKLGSLDLKGGDFASFLAGLDGLEERVAESNHEVSRIESEIADLEVKSKKFKALLERLKS